MRRLLLALTLTAVAAPAPAADPPKDFFFQPKDRVLFLGDSITEQYQYSTDIELYLTTRFPGANFFFLNAGIGGDTANGGAGRFQNHVLAEKPTAVTINFGMNDAGYGAFDANRNKQYREKTAAMLEAAQKAGVRVALISPNAVDRRVQDRFKLYLETQKQFYAPLKELADQHGATFVDQYAATRAALEAMEKTDPQAKAAKPFGDGFHTSSPGGLLMAHAILTGLKAPAVVSDVTINGKTEKVEATNCTVTDVKAADGGALTFVRTDAALPLPVQKDWLPMLPYTNELKDLNWYGLKITDLTPDAKYVVKIDGTEVGRYTGADLAAGVNLGNLTAGPVWDHANKVLQSINAKNQIVHGRFRGVMLAQVPDWLADVAKERKQKELESRMEKIVAAQTAVNKLAQPKPHTFEVTLAK